MEKGAKSHHTCRQPLVHFPLLALWGTQTPIKKQSYISLQIPTSKSLKLITRDKKPPFTLGFVSKNQVYLMNKSHLTLKILTHSKEITSNSDLLSKHMLSA